MNIKHNRTISRRSYLKGCGGIVVALPFLNIMTSSAADTEKKIAAEQRLAILAIPFGMVQDKFHPKETGFNYTMSDTLQHIKHIRNDFTVFSHLENDVRGGHAANHAFLSGVTMTDRNAHPEGNMTIDQGLAEKIGHHTRFPSLNFAEGTYSFTRTGVSVPAVSTPSKAFRLMFVDDSAASKESTKKSLKSSGSILDAIRENAKRLQKRLGKEDKEKLEEYFTSIRGTEKQFAMSEDWLDKPKPKLKAGDNKTKSISDGDSDNMSANVMLDAWFELMFLALQTNSTRIVTIGINNWNFDLEGVKDAYHRCSHHGLQKVYLDQLAITEKYLVTKISDFVQRLNNIQMPNGETMLKSTQVLLGSGMGSGSRHTNSNPAILLAGGRYKHGQHINAQTKQPLCSLYLTMMQHMLNDFEIERFSVSDGPLKGLEIINS